MSSAQQFQRYRGFPVHKPRDQINHAEPLISHVEPQISHAEPRDLRIGQQVTNNKCSEKTLKQNLQADRERVSKPAILQKIIKPINSSLNCQVRVFR